MVNYCDSFETYLTGLDLEYRYFINNYVDVSTVSGQKWLTSNSGCVCFVAASSNYISYSFDFVITGTPTYPFYLCGIKTRTDNDSSKTSGQIVIRVNSDRTFTYITPNSYDMNSAAAVATTGSTPTGLVGVSGEVNRFAFYCNLANRTDNSTYLNGVTYTGQTIPTDTFTSGCGLVVGNPKNGSEIMYRNLVFRGKTSSEGIPNPLMSHKWNVGVLYPDTTVSGNLSITGTAEHFEAVTGISDTKYVYGNALGVDRYTVSNITGSLVGSSVVGVQVNSMYYAPSSNMSGILNVTGINTYYTLSSVASSIYDYRHYNRTPDGNLWTPTIVNNTDIGVSS